ncbi:hypothetical protein TWF569_010347 [Orbilia oligospora]|uniref:Zn(2)-C6 fungal-type domain-containing protein n=1 Tax=Orbilia oligospora TaxID=2813651 RepID=A0A7C8NPM6_ORBOL|nr:hypothetical protein TWF103_000784 [Orbilia oligospora]KAF3099147.1 hypothetical protein TWF102_005554 [Orbilia oligospora]KAF3115561.1 hypothetical protein TWF706_005685 [Orbilia oligospora]KAF3133957.1 hypothetical protein TWF569_010347 [Orbilia oligospora]
MDRPKSKPKSRACVGCRSMKIKCVPVPKSSKCEACLRLVRPCEAPGPIKPRIKQAQRFQELERKIEILTSALQPERAGPDPSFVQNQNVPVEDGSGYSGGLPTRNQYSQAPVSPSAIIGTGDVIDQGVIDISTASNLLNYWKENIRPIFPIIQFSANQDVHSIRRDTPVLFLTILTISSASIDPTFLDRLLPRLNNLFAQEVFVLGNRSIDLLQALILFSQHHIQPPEAKTFPLTQHVYNAMAMASDLMLEEKVKATANKPNESTLEACRILLGIYFAASASSTLLRRSQFNFFQPNYQKYAKILMDTDSSNLDDLWLCKIVELQQISEDASLSLNQPYNVEADSFEDSKTRSLFNLLQHRLSEWDKDNSGLVDSRLSAIAKLSIELQTNQVGIRGFNHKMGLEYKSSYQEGRAIQNPSITAFHLQSLSRSLEICRGILNSYISLETPLARSLPDIFFVWIMYAGVCLAKLSSFIDRFTFDRFGETNSDERSSVADLLGAVHQRLAVHSQNGYLPQAQPFETVFLKLKTWHVQKKSFCINLHRGCKEPAGPIHDILSGEIVDETGQKISTHANTNTFAPAETMEAHEQYGINQPLGLTPPLTIDDIDMIPEEYESQDFSNNQPVYDPFGSMDPDSEGGMQFSVEEMQDFDMSMTYNNYFWMLPFLK